MHVVVGIAVVKTLLLMDKGRGLLLNGVFGYRSAVSGTCVARTGANGCGQNKQEECYTCVLFHGFGFIIVSVCITGGIRT